MKVFWTLLSVVSFSVCSAGQVTSIQTQGDWLIFETTEAKVEPLPSCVELGNNSLWAMSLLTPEGNAAQLMLTAAVTTNLSVEVKSGGGCLETSKIESAKSLTLLDLK